MPEPVDHVDAEVRFRVVLDRATVPVEGIAFRLPPGNYDVTMMRHHGLVMGADEIRVGETWFQVATPDGDPVWIRSAECAPLRQ
jgi:hypothetical protein